MSKWKSGFVGVALATALVAAGSASAAIVSVGPASSINASSLNLGTVSFTPTPATQIYLVNNSGPNDYSALFSPQSPANVQAGVESLFGLTPGSLTLVADVVNITPNPATDVSGGLSFNYAALHNAQGEIVFYYATPISEFDISHSRGSSISNIRFFATAVPEPSTWGMMALGFAALAFAGYRSRKGSISIA